MTTPPLSTYTEAENHWTFHSLQSGYENRCNLSLYYEVHFDPMSDDYDPADPNDPDATALFRMWTKKPGVRRDDGAVPIYWFVDSTDSGPLEAAPYVVSEEVAPSGDFLAHYSTPLNAATRRPINWLRLPVIEKAWRPGQANKGGFITESTGWRPSPLQPSVPLAALIASAQAETA